MNVLIKLIVCMAVLGLAVYFYIDAHNQLIQVQLSIPPLQKQLRALVAENARLQYEIDRFESPSHLMELAQKPEFSHMKAAYKNKIIIIPLEQK